MARGRNHQTVGRIGKPVRERAACGVNGMTIYDYSNPHLSLLDLTFHGIYILHFIEISAVIL
jgi:hypothetical protein